MFIFLVQGAEKQDFCYFSQNLSIFSYFILFLAEHHLFCILLLFIYITSIKPQIYRWCKTPPRWIWFPEGYAGMESSGQHSAPFVPRCWERGLAVGWGRSLPGFSSSRVAKIVCLGKVSEPEDQTAGPPGLSVPGLSVHPTKPFEIS